MISTQKIKSFALSLLMLSSTVVKGSDDLNAYYRDVFMGEKKTANYSGPLDPRSVYSDYSGDLVLLDDIFQDRYLNREIQESSFDLHRYWFDEVVEKSACPDNTLSENIDYIRYLYRLVSISYLFEGIKLNHKIANQLGSKNICSIAFKDVFNGCTPQSSDMKKFHERVYGKFVNEIEKNKIEAFSKKELAAWMESFQATTSLTTDPAFSRLHEWCIANKKNCRTLKPDEIKEALSGFCSSDTKNIQLLCSEKDNFYGLYGISTASELIKTSNAFNLINQSGMGEECLRRYGKLFRNKEATPIILSKQFPILYSHLIKKSAQYPQGELFLPGALKEFDVKGLSDFLSALKPPAPEPVIIIVKRKPKAKPKPVVVEVKVKVPEPKVEAPVVIAPPAPVVPAMSEFERAAKEIDDKKATSATLDMEVFRDDFEFTQAMITALSGPIKKFQTRAGLSDMKSYDLLGSEEVPVELIYLKFLIDTENHKGLYNITAVLGEKFYVVNNIEKKTKSYYMQLKNDASTRNRWQIILLKK